MALVKSQTWTAISGSVGGVTWARSSAGYYMRARTIPVNPVTTFQQQVRAALNTFVTRWATGLTPAERAAWNTYAANVPVVNRIGDTINLSGQNWYIACNAPRSQAVQKGFSGLTPIAIDDAPTIFDRGDFTTPTALTATTAAGIGFDFDNTDAWATEDGAGMLVFQGRPRNPSRTFFAGPYRLIDVVLGDSVTPPTSPHSISASGIAADGFPLVAGQRIDVVVAVTRADARLSTRRLVGSVTIS